MPKVKTKIAIYASKEIRGRIIAKTISACGIETSIVKDPDTAIGMIESAQSRLVILDVNNCLDEKLSVIQAVAARIPEFVLVIHSNAGDLSLLTEMGLRETQCLSGTLDPEAVFLKVKEQLKEIKAKYGYFKFPKTGKFLSWRRKRKISIAKNNRNKFHLAIFGKPSSGLYPKRFLPRIPPGLRLVINLVLIPLILFVGIAGGYSYWTILTLPDIDPLNSFSPYKSSKLYSSDNVLLKELYVQRRTPVALDLVPEHVKNAFVAIEDARYFEHSGIDPIRILGALYADIKAGEYKQGGSTITQQLAKMIFLTPEKTIARKVREIAIALQLEKKFTKDQILELYLNQAYFGSRAYGIQAAAEAYFGKGVDGLTLSEGAMLAGLPKAPSAYSPFKSPEKCRTRRKFVLKRMLETGAIDDVQYRLALKKPLPDKFHARVSAAPYFVDYSIGRLTERFGDQLYTGGLKIYSTLDYRMQKLATEAVRKGVADLQSRGVVNVQAALVAIEIETGRIRAIVGGTDYKKSQFNRATQAMRQPGSAFKPFVYLTALLEGYNHASIIQDKPVTITTDKDPRPWRPKNYSGKYRGAVSMKKGLALSLNAATVNLALKVGIRNVVKTAKQLGIESKIHPIYPSALGASETTLLELVSAYTALASGKRMEPDCIDRIINKETMSLQEPAGTPEIVINQSALSDIRIMLNAVVEQGTGRKALRLNRKVYGKTGTTNRNVDALFVGFDDKLAVGVWVGRDDHEPIGKKETGARAALPIWIDFMENVPYALTGIADKETNVDADTLQDGSMELERG